MALSAAVREAMKALLRNSRTWKKKAKAESRKGKKFDAKVLQKMAGKDRLKAAAMGGSNKAKGHPMVRKATKDAMRFSDKQERAIATGRSPYGKKPDQIPKKHREKWGREAREEARAMSTARARGKPTIKGKKPVVRKPKPHIRAKSTRAPRRK